MNQVTLLRDALRPHLAWGGVEVVIISWEFLPTELPWTETTVTNSLKLNLHSVTIKA